MQQVNSKGSKTTAKAARQQQRQQDNSKGSKTTAKAARQQQRQQDNSKGSGQECPLHTEL